MVTCEGMNLMEEYTQIFNNINITILLKLPSSYKGITFISMLCHFHAIYLYICIYFFKIKKKIQRFQHWYVRKLECHIFKIYDKKRQTKTNINNFSWTYDVRIIPKLNLSWKAETSLCWQRFIQSSLWFFQ